MNDIHYAGASSEYYAASWFLSRGYQVWWPSAQADSADFVVSKDNQFSRIQVKKAYWSRKATTENLKVTLQRATHRTYRDGDFDFVMVVAVPELWLIPWEGIKGKKSISLATRGENKRTPYLKDYDPNKWRVY